MDQNVFDRLGDLWADIDGVIDRWRDGDPVEPAPPAETPILQTTIGGVPLGTVALLGAGAIFLAVILRR